MTSRRPKTGSPKALKKGFSTNSRGLFAELIKRTCEPPPAMAKRPEGRPEGHPEDRVENGPEDRAEAGALGDGLDEAHRRTGALRAPVHLARQSIPFVRNQLRRVTVTRTMSPVRHLMSTVRSRVTRMVMALDVAFAGCTEVRAHGTS
jgi:hypothetical protein